MGLIIKAHGLLHHCYADDTQLYLCGRPVECAGMKSRVLQCIDSISVWMSSNRLKLNPSKSEFLWCSTARRLHLVDKSVFRLEDGDVTQSTFVRNLGAFFDASMDMSTDVNRLVGACFYQLRRIRAIRRSIPTSTAILLVNSFVVSRFDYCNSILAGLPACEFNRIQSVLNSAARLIYGRSKYDHVTPLLRDKLHWLRAEQRVRYKCCLLVYKALNGLASSYIEQFCNKVAVSETRACLRSSTHNNLVIPRSLTKFGVGSVGVERSN